MDTAADGFETTIAGGNGAPDVPVFAACPPGATRGAVILHEVFGRQPEIDRVVERFARAGYAAVAPELFSHGLKPLCIARCVRQMRAGAGPQIDEVQLARKWLCARTGVAQEKVGLIGFCLGGGFALASGRGWGAVSANYGDVPPEEVLRGIGPVIGCFGGRDRAFRGKDRLLEARLTALGVPHEVHLFPEAGHSFLTDGDHPIGYALVRPLMHIVWNPAVAEQGWEKIFAFFAQHL